MDLLKTKQIRSIMQEVEHAVFSSGSTTSDEDDRERNNTRRRESAASQDRWADSITSSSLGPSIWGAQVSSQERGRASRSASFSVGQEFSGAPIAGPTPLNRDREDSLPYDSTRLLREQFQQMKFRNRSKSSYAAAWHVPHFEDNDESEEAIADEDDFSAGRLRRGEPPGLRYTTPSNPRLDNLRDKERRASFNTTANVQNRRSFGQAEIPPRESHHVNGSGQISGHEHGRIDPNMGHGQSSASFAPGHHASPPLGETDSYGNLLANVDRYFSSDDHRTRSRTHMAQTAAAQSALLTQATPSMPTGPLYIVEFKACRTDVFYVADSSGLKVHVGDLVIVEADRGRDLGKVIREDVTMAQVRALKAQQAREQALAIGGIQDDSEKINLNNIQPKLIYRLSQPSEIAMLLVKNQDEQQAMLVCQAKVRQRKLPMEVLDGEYQWDRRKLTFYYYASQRIDFRELVRDLFKIYKTRIWMCASNPTSVSNANISLGAPGAIGEPKGGMGAQAYHYQADNVPLGPNPAMMYNNKGPQNYPSQYDYQRDPDYAHYSPYVHQALY